MEDRRTGQLVATLSKEASRASLVEGGLTSEDIRDIAVATADEVMARIAERESDLDILHGTVAGPGAIPLHDRETRREPCWGCRIDPTKPLEAGNVMATTKDAIGTLSQDEVRRWCSELIEVEDGRCARARAIREAAAACREKHPDDTQKFFECFAPAFAGLKKSNPARVRFARGDIDSAIEAAKRLKSDRDLYVFATYLGYTIDNRPPPGIQAYVIVHSDGTTETIKPALK